MKEISIPVITATVTRLSDGPCLRVIVTGCCSGQWLSKCWKTGDKTNRCITSTPCELRCYAGLDRSRQGGEGDLRCCRCDERGADEKKLCKLHLDVEVNFWLGASENW